MLTEMDLELLQAYLDDALSSADVERLDRRLNEETDLSGGLDRLRNERAARIAFFQSRAPTKGDADRFADNVFSSLRRRERRMKLAFVSRIAAGIAACLLIGFAVGWAGRGGFSTAPSRAAAAIKPSVDSRLVVHSPKPVESGRFQVAILDEDGNVIAVQRFNKLEDARRFTDDLAQYQARRQQVQDGQATLVSDTF